MTKNNFDLDSMSTSWHKDVEVRDVDRRISDSFNLHTQMLSKEDKLKMSELFRDITVILEDHEKQVVRDFKKKLIRKINRVPKSSWDTEPLHVCLTVLKELNEDTETGI